MQFVSVDLLPYLFLSVCGGWDHAELVRGVYPGVQAFLGNDYT